MTSLSSQSPPVAADDVITTAETIAPGQPEDLWSSCPLRFWTQMGVVVLGVIGLMFNYLALVVLWKDQELRRSFRSIQSSLTAADLCFSLTSVLAGSVDLATFLTPDKPEVVQWHQFRSTACSVVNGLYYGLMGCHATNTLIQSFDRALAVSVPLKYRSCMRWQRLTFDQIGSVAVVPAWIIAFLEIVSVPIAWYFSDDSRFRVDEDGLSCLPFIAITDELLLIHAVLLLVSVLGVALACVGTICKLSETAVLVVPFFGTRTADNSANERLQIRRSTKHALTQASSFSVFYMPVAIYMLWLGLGSVSDRTIGQVCNGYSVMPLLPSVNNVIIPLLTLWRVPNWTGYCAVLRTCCCCCVSARVHPAKKGRGGNNNSGGGAGSSGVGPSSSRLKVPQGGEEISISASFSLSTQQLSTPTPTPVRRDLASSSTDDEAARKHVPLGTLFPDEDEAEVGDSPDKDEPCTNADKAGTNHPYGEKEEEGGGTQAEHGKDVNEEARTERDKYEDEDNMPIDPLGFRVPPAGLKSTRKIRSIDSETNSVSSSSTRGSYNKAVDDCRANPALLHWTKETSLQQ